MSVSCQTSWFLEKKQYSRVFYFRTWILVTFRKQFCMMPLTPAERQKLYRERLKERNPEKFLTQKRKNAERTKRNRMKIAECSSSMQEIIRKQWRDRKKKSKEALQPEEVPSVDNAQILKQKRNQSRRVIYKLKTENIKLKDLLRKYKQSLKNLRQKLNRCVRKNNEQLEIIKKKDELICNFEERLNSSANITKDVDFERMTPSSKTNAYIHQNLPNIRPEEKERVKKTLLEHHVIMESIKESYKSNNTQEKRIIKNVFSKNDTINRYCMKTKIATYLGLKGKIRHTLQKNKSYLIQTQLRDFYERDDVSRMTAGKNEIKTQKKQKKQRRYLLGTLHKLYKKYRQEGGKLSFATFKRYRPFYVLPPKAEKRDTCACKRHENLQMKATVLQSIGLIATKDLDELLCMVVCDLKSKKCSYGECDLCKNKYIDFTTGEKNLNDNISWDEWVLKSHEYKPKKNSDVTKTTKKIDKERKTGSLRMLLDAFQEELQNFKIHSYNIIHQYKEYRRCINNLDDRTVALHIDFSENYACKLSTEIQAMHFDGSRQQISLHTGILYTAKGNQSFASMSPSKEHGPDAIWAHLLPVLELIKQKLSKVNGIHFYSDGPTVQYRQKKNFYYFSKLTTQLGFPFSTWNFFEASHGKGAADGVGGAIKRKLDSFVAYGSDVPDAKTAFELLQASETKLQLFYVPEDAILNESVDLVPVPETMKIHQIVNNVESAYSIFYRYLSCFCEKSRPGFCDCINLKSAGLLKQTAVKNDKTITPKKRITILSDIKNTEQNKSYFDLTQYGPFTFKEVDPKTIIVATTSKENVSPSVDKMNTKKNTPKKRKLDINLRTTTKKIRKECESSTDEDLYSLHDSSDEDYHITDNEVYFDDKNCQIEEQKKISDLSKETDLKEMERKRTEQSRYEDEKNIYSNKKVTEISLISNENERKIKTKGESVLATAQQNDLKDFDSVNFNDSEVTSENQSDIWRLCFKDTVLVRYYQRRSWKYYIGFIEDIRVEEGKSYFTIRFLKTVKKPVLRFVDQKIKDQDTITEDYIVKQIKITQNIERPKEYFLAATSDEVYFE